MMATEDREAVNVPVEAQGQVYRYYISSSACRQPKRMPMNQKGMGGREILGAGRRRG